MKIADLIALYDAFGAPGQLEVHESALLSDQEVIAGPAAAAALREWWPRIGMLLEVTRHADAVVREGIRSSAFDEMSTALTALEAS